MKTCNRIILFLLPLAVLFCGKVYSQTKTEGGGIPSDEIDIVGDYRPTLADPLRVALSPRMNQRVEVPRKNLSYLNPTKELDYAYAKINPKPIAHRETLEKLQNFYFKGGAGNAVLPFVHIGFGSGRNNLGSFGLEAIHMSLKGSLQNQNSHESLARAFGEYLFAGHALNADLSYSQDQFHRYGYNNEDTAFNAGQVKNKFQDIALHLSLENREETNIELDHESHVDLGYLFNDKLTESRANLSSDLEYPLNDEIRLRLSPHFSMNALNKPYQLSRMIFGAKPGVVWKQDKWKLGLDLNLAYETDHKQFYALQDLQLERSLIDEQVIFFTQWNRYLQWNNYHNLRQVNPFIADSIHLLNSVHEERMFGFRGGFKEQFFYQITAGQQLVDNLPLFINDSLDQRQFTMSYDSSARIWDLGLDLSFKPNSNWDFGLGLDFHNYEKLQNHSKAFHRPNFLANLSATYSPSTKWRFQADLLGVGARWAIDTGTNVQLDPAADLNLQVVYKHNNRFSAFLEGNNLFNQKFQRFYKYPVVGLSLWGGLIINF